MNQSRFLALLLLSLISITKTIAQSYPGFITENYSGVNSVINNPANIADSRFAFDLNFAGAHGSAFNDAFSAESLSDLTKDDFDLDNDLLQSFKDDNALYVNTDILGPSFLININRKNTIALYTRARVISNALLNGNDINQIDDLDDLDLEDPATLLNINQANSGADFHGWGEIGISYARIIKEDSQHFLKAGITAKYLVGIGSGYARTNNLVGTFQGNPDGGEGFYSGSIDLDGTLNYGLSNEDFENLDLDNISEFELPRSFGFDIGAVYEFRPNYEDYKIIDKKGNEVLDPTKNKYKVRVGIAVTDIGAITYNRGVESDYQINGESIDFINEVQAVVVDPSSDIDDITTVLQNNQDFIDQVAETTGFGELLDDLQNAATVAEVESLLNQNSDELIQALEDIENADDLESILTDFNLVTASTTTGIKASLPTALNFNADYSFNNNLFLNLSSAISLRSRKVKGNVRIANEVMLTPRYESRIFSFYSPLRIQNGAGLDWGAGMRLGPLYLGSGSIISNLLLGNINGADVFAGLKMPILRKAHKDMDGDGIKDKKDGCPDKTGPIENNGCPWPDTDGDNILDKDDDCPENVGPKENNGCPWPDTDGDTVLDKDDACPEVLGDAENDGCPWPDTDGDSVLDKNDNCPKEAGTVANSGCPEVKEVTETVQKTLNEYAKTILFETGRADIKEQSLAVLVDIVTILNEYPEARFTVEGHTDSIGNATLNQQLSEKRANSVRDFLISQGIAGDRLQAIGYGETKPIATNMYKSGREQNRRVEINLLK